MEFSFHVSELFSSAGMFIPLAFCDHDTLKKIPGQLFGNIFPNLGVCEDFS